MKHRTVRGLTALSVTLAVLLAGCSSSGDDAATDSPSDSASTPAADPAADQAALATVTVAGDVGSEPTLTVPTPLSVTADTVAVHDEGTGDDITADSVVELQLVVYSGADGKLVSSSWADAPTPYRMVGNGLPTALTEAFVGHKVGTRILFAQPVQRSDGTTETAVYALDALSAAPAPATRAEGEAVTPPEGLPTVTLDQTGKPSITIPDGYAAPTDLVAQTLIKGSGPVVESGQGIEVQYTGWKLSDGTQFDTSWSGPDLLLTTIGTGSVIKGWDQGLVGQTVGSQVLLVIPRSLAYGDAPSSELKDEDLVFVVDILRVL